MWFKGETVVCPSKCTQGDWDEEDDGKDNKED